MGPYKIAIIAGQLVVGGAERQLYLWLSHMDRQRFEPVVVTLHPDCGDYWEEPIEALGVPLLRVARGRNPLVRLLEITRALRPHGPHLIHGWHLFASPYAGAAAILLGAKASLGSMRGSYKAYRHSRTQSALTRWLTDGILANSAWVARQLADTRWPLRGRVFVVRNGVEDEVEERDVARRQLSEKYAIVAESIWIGSVGRLQRSKRFDLLLGAMASLRGAGENVSLVIIGSGEMLPALLTKAGALGVSGRVAFIREDASVRHWMSALDIFCFLSEDEGLPNVVMEAAVAGVPVVAWRTPFLEEVLEGGRSAVLVAQGNIRALEGALAELVQDAPARRRLGRRGRSRVLEQFSIGRFVNDMTNVYECLLIGVSEPPDVAKRSRELPSPERAEVAEAAAGSASES